LGFLLHIGVPTYAGRQFLADADSVLVIDGVSEIPDATAATLAEELSALLIRQDVVSVVVVGRDSVALRRVLAPAAAVEAFTLSALQVSAQERIVDNVVGLTVGSAERSQILQRASRALGDGVRSPMLLTIYLEAAREASFDLSRAEVYEKFVASLSERSPTVDAKSNVPVLGVVFARLLTAQRRYSDPYEWISLTNEAAASVSPSLDGDEVRNTALRMGLVREIGTTGIVAPFHDSIADYLAATAVAAGLAALPPKLRETHSEWVLFGAELGVDVSDEIAGQLPFLAVHAATADHLVLDTAAFVTRIETLLDSLLGTNGCVVTATETLDGRWLVRANGADGTALGAPVIDPGRGPLYAAMRIWRLVLRGRLSGVQASLSGRPATVEQAKALVVEFVRTRQRETGALLTAFPPGQRSRLLEKLRPLGMSFHIGEPETIWTTEDWPMTYMSSVETRALAVGPVDRAGQTSVSHFLEGGPARAAASDLSDAIEQLVDRRGWLA
jgi:hypothetical protein